MPILEQPTRIEREDRVVIPGISIVPDLDAATKTSGAGVVILAGEWGLTEDLLARFARPLAEDGLWVVATDLVLGALAGSDADAKRAAAGIDDASAVGDLAGAILQCKRVATGKIGVVAFDRAARIAFEAMAELPHIDALVHASGPAPGDHAKLERARATSQLHRAKDSAQFSREDLDAIVARLERGRAMCIGYDYDCRDGFFARPSGDAEALQARIAMDRTRQFLLQNLT